MHASYELQKVTLEEQNAPSHGGLINTVGYTNITLSESFYLNSFDPETANASGMPPLSLLHWQLLRTLLSQLNAAKPWRCYFIQKHSSY